MKKQFLALSMMVVMLATACSKSKDQPKEQEITCQLNEASVTGGGETITHKYTFNTQGLINTVNSSAVIGSGSPTVENYSYSNTQNSIIIDNVVYTLEQGRITKEVETNGSDKITYNYTYDSNGYLTKKASNDYTWNYKWTNGNLTEIEIVGSNYTDTETYEYSSTVKPANFYSDAPDLPMIYNHLFKLMGKQPKNLISKENGQENYTYTFDSNNNVVSLNDSYSSYTFKYDCK